MAAHPKSSPSSSSDALRMEQIRRMWLENKTSFAELPVVTCEEIAQRVLDPNRTQGTSDPPMVIVDTRSEAEQQVRNLWNSVLVKVDIEDDWFKVQMPFTSSGVCAARANNLKRRV